MNFIDREVSRFPCHSATTRRSPKRALALRVENCNQCPAAPRQTQISSSPRTFTRPSTTPSAVGQGNDHAAPHHFLEVRVRNASHSPRCENHRRHLARRHPLFSLEKYFRPVTR